MKSRFVITLVSFLILALAKKPLLADPIPLLDVDGNQVVATLEYYVVSTKGGGLTLHSQINSQCPFVVLGTMGTRISFRPNDNTSVIYEATDLNVRFSILDGCIPVWKVDNYSESTGKWFIRTGGVEGNPGAQTLLNWFKFEKHEVVANENAYKIRYCPSVCESCVHLCNNIGISLVEEADRLVLLPDDEEALSFLIIPAKEGLASM